MEKNIEKTKEGVLLKIKASPNSENFEIGEINKWTNRLEIRLSSKARKGEANKELIENMEETLNKKVRIKNGIKSRKKTLLIISAKENEVKKKLNPGE